MFYLKQYNKTLLQFDIEEDNLDGQKINSLKDVSGSDSYLLPIGVEASPESLMKWLKSRIIPKNLLTLSLRKTDYHIMIQKESFKCVRGFH